MSSNYKELFLTTTDTILGLGAPVSKQNKEHIYTLKKRPSNKPLVIMVSSVKEARKLEGWTNKAEKLSAEVWPGATTLVLTDEVSVRIPNNKGLIKLLSQIGPVYMTSANISGERRVSLQEAKEVFHEVETYYDFGKGSNKPSTIIDVRTGEKLR